MEETLRKDVRPADGYAWDALPAGTLDRQNLSRRLLFSTNSYLLTRSAVHAETNRAIEHRREDCRDCESDPEGPSDSS
jgi:hypothetical protein